jgi:hypothetical protein
MEWQQKCTAQFLRLVMLGTTINISNLLKKYSKIFQLWNSLAQQPLCWRQSGKCRCPVTATVPNGTEFFWHPTWLKSFPYIMQQNCAPERGTYICRKEVTSQTAVQNTTCSSHFWSSVARTRYAHMPLEVGNLTGINVNLSALCYIMVIFQMGWICIIVLNREFSLQKLDVQQQQLLL